MAEPLYRLHTRSETLELSAQQGRGVDIPTNIGPIKDAAPRHAPARDQPATIATSNDQSFDKDVEKDMEAGGRPESLFSSDGVEAAEPVGLEHPNVVSWDGPDDPQNPMNWSSKKKWGTVLIVSAVTFLTPLASSMFAPGVPEVMKTFNSTNDMLASFMVSIYVLGFAFGPMIIAPLSEMYGRLPLYHSCNVLFIVFSISAAVASSMSQFIVFRFFMGCFGGAPLVLGGGTIADLIPRDQRGTAMAVWMMGPTLGPCVGPVIGAFLTQATGWRWNFWFISILAGAFTIGAVILMSETSASTILERKTKRLRAQTGNGKLRSKLASDLSPRDLFKFSIVRPIKMLLFSPICAAMSIYVAITYAYLYILFTTLTPVYSNQYNWKGGILGLSFLGLGVGSLVGQFVFTKFGNKIARTHIERGDFRPEHRLYIMAGGGLVLPIGLFWYGWSVQARVHWMAPITGTGAVGFGLLMTFMPANTYLVDVFTVHAASAMAANTVLRSLAAALIPLSSQKMYAAMGYGWGNSLLGFIALLLIPIPFLFMKYGERIRARSTVRL